MAKSGACARREYLYIFGAGGGGGVIIASTVVFKFLIVWLKLPVLGEALLFGLNYAGSFLLMQGLGFRLATKQPALLAVTLLRRRRSGTQMSHLLAIIRAQIAATLGNFGFVVLAALCFHCAYAFGTGTIFLTDEAARHTLSSLDLMRSGTIGYAALTGFLLWVASLAAGWASHEARRGRSGPGQVKRAAGVGFNLALAFLLCLVPLIGKSFNLPLDVRHFTLSSGALALSVYTLGLRQAWQAGLAQASLGIAVIGVMNFGVSFLMSLSVALRAFRLGWAIRAPGGRTGFPSRWSGRGISDLRDARTLVVPRTLD